MMHQELMEKYNKEELKGVLLIKVFEINQIIEAIRLSDPDKKEETFCRKLNVPLDKIIDIMRPVMKGIKTF